MRNSNPYTGVDWNNRIEIVSSTHMHCYKREHLEKYLQDGFNLIAASNYYPSAPYYPISSIRENTFKCGQNWVIKDGKLQKAPVDFNQAVSCWIDELSQEARAGFPFEPGERMFADLPEGVLEIPNAEHHWFSDASIYLHITAPGSMAVSGHFDSNGQYGLSEHGYCLGCPLPWREGFTHILDSLLIPDGGGIVLNHPTWSHLPVKFLCEMLDFDPRVLGIEVFSDGARNDFTDFADTTWDEILSTGRQCYGFFVQDHPRMDRPMRGKIVILPEERTGESCLRALRQGRFYGVVSDNGLRFEHLSFDGNTLTARCNREVTFQLLSAVGVIGDVIRGKEVSFTVPESEKKDHVFLRLTAIEGRECEKIFSQAFML